MKLGDVEEGPVSLTCILTCKFTMTQHNVCWLSIIQADSTYSVQTHQSDHIFSYCYFCLVAESCPTLPCSPLSSGVCSNSLPLSQWCYPTISFSAAPLSSCLQSFPISGSLPTNRLFASGGQSPGTSASASVIPMNQGWFPLGLTGFISLMSKA